MSVAHYLPHTTKPFSFNTKVADRLAKAASHLHAPSGDSLMNVAFGAVALYGATMVLSLLTL